MPQKIVVDRSGLRNVIVDHNPLKPDPEKVAELRRLGKGGDLGRQTILQQIEEEMRRCKE